MATSWADMIKRGCDIAWVVRIEGIRVLFTERDIKRADSASDVSLPSGYTAACSALLISDRDAVGTELDRKTGVARGNAWEILLAWNALEDDGLLDDLFARPSVTTSLAAVPDAGSDSVLEYNGTTIKVASTTGLSNGQGVYLGKEAIAIGAVDGDGVSLTSCTRGLAGYAYQFDSQSFGNYRQLTDRPTLWRGRFVELHAHLVSREGRILDDTWLGGDYHKCIWRGYLDAPPVPDQHGMRLRALPLCRLAGNDLGFEVKGEIVNSVSVPSDWKKPTDELAGMLIMPNGNGVELLLLHMTYTASGATTTKSFLGPTATFAAAPAPLGGWLLKLREAWGSALAAEGIVSHESLVTVQLLSNGAFMVSILLASGYVVDSARIVPSPSAYWVPDVTHETHVHTPNFVMFQIPIEVESPSSGWMPIRVVSGEGLQDITIPASGLGVIEGGEAREIVRWSEKNESILATTGITMLRIVEREINGTHRAEFATGGTLSVMSGYSGTPATVIRTVLESSGTGSRGSYDTLDFGQGLGIPEAWIDLSALMSAWQISSYAIAAVNTGRSSLEDMIGGWLALAGLNMAQVVSASGECQISVVGTQPIASASAVNITAADVLLESIGVPQVVDAPNEIKIDPTGLDKAASITVRDVPRIQSEGPRSWSMKVPSIEQGMAVDFGKALIAMGDGQTAVSMSVGAWVEVQPGDVVKLTTAHPAMFDWGTGARGPSTVYGRCVGLETHLATAKQRITLLLSGGRVETSYLAPSPYVVAKMSATVVLLPAGAVSWFAEDDYVVLYTPGNDTAQVEQLQIDSINTAGNSLTFTSTPASWVGAGAVVTQALWANATDAQKLFMYTRAEKGWGI